MFDISRPARVAAAVAATLALMSGAEAAEIVRHPLAGGSSLDRGLDSVIRTVRGSGYAAA